MRAVSVTFREISSRNWRETLALGVAPEQQRFVAGYVPIAAIVLAKAYVQAGGLIWTPYAVYAGHTSIGLFALAYQPESADTYWLYHFFIDQRYQGKGYGAAALQAVTTTITTTHPRCACLNLTVHSENHRAQRMYAQAGFRPTGQAVDDEPVYQLRFGDVLRDNEGIGCEHRSRVTRLSCDE